MKGRPALRVLPIELWELILDETSDQNLLVVARVCHVLNEVAIRLYLRRNKTSLQSPTLEIRAHLIRALFILSCDPPKPTAIHCAFWSFGIGRGLLMLRSVVEKWETITELKLELPFNLLRHVEYEGDWSRRIPRKLYLGALRRMLAVVARRIGRPVIVVAGQTVHRCEADALARWELVNMRNDDIYHSTMGFWKRAWNEIRSRSKPVGEGKPHISIRVKGEENVLLDYIASLHIRPVQLGQLGDVALLEFDTPTLTLKPSASFSASDISSLLPYLRIPSLATIELGTTNLDPGTFGDMLASHPQLRTFRLNCRWDSSGPICVTNEVPSSLYSLVCTEDVADLGILLDTFDLPTRPLHSIEFTLRRFTTKERDALTGSLVRLSQRTRRTVLELVLPLGLCRCPALAQGEIDALTNLDRVDSIRVYTDSIGDAYAVLAWVKHLPALVRFEWSSLRNRHSSSYIAPTKARRSKLLAFERAAKKELPNTQHVWARS